MYFPDDVWRYIVKLSLPVLPPWERRFLRVVHELEQSNTNRTRPTVLRMENGILCIARQFVFRGYHRTLMEYAYLNLNI